MLSTDTHTNKERKSRGDLSVVTLQIVLKKKEEKKKKKEKETKTCGVFLDSACGCCKKTAPLLDQRSRKSTIVGLQFIRVQK